jgi:hypothetical protein
MRTDAAVVSSAVGSGAGRCSEWFGSAINEAKSTARPGYFVTGDTRKSARREGRG